MEQKKKKLKSGSGTVVICGKLDRGTHAQTEAQYR